MASTGELLPGSVTDTIPELLSCPSHSIRMLVWDGARCDIYIVPEGRMVGAGTAVLYCLVDVLGTVGRSWG